MSICISDAAKDANMLPLLLSILSLTGAKTDPDLFVFADEVAAEAKAYVE